MSVPANYVFLPWVRQGAAAGIQITDMTTAQPGVVSVSVKLQVNDDLDQINQTVRLYGPGEVIGIDLRQVVRTDPHHLTQINAYYISRTVQSHCLIDLI